MINRWLSWQSIAVACLCGAIGCASTGDDYESAGDPVTTGVKACFYESSVKGMVVLDQQNLIVSTRSRGDYHVTLSSRARGLSSRSSIQFYSMGGAICRGAELIVHNSSCGPDRFRVSSIREVSPAEVDALLVHHGRKAPDIDPSTESGQVQAAEIEELAENADLRNEL